MNKGKILVITTNELENPVRGTPIRIVEVIRLFQKERPVLVCASSVDKEFEDVFIPLPKGNFIKRALFYKEIIKENEVEFLWTATETDIKMLIFLKYLTGKKIFIEQQGLTNEENLYFGKITPLQAKINGFMARIYYRMYDHVFTMSKKATRYLGLSPAHSSVAYGGVYVDNVTPADASSSRDKFTVSYMGNARGYQGLDVLMAALEKVVKRGNLLHLSMVVSSDKEAVAELAKRHGLSDLISIDEKVPHDKLLSTISNADVIVIPRPSLKITEYAYPSKLPECLATGVPVILTDVGPVEELFKDEKVCIIVRPGDIDDMARGIEEVMSMSREERMKLGKRGREYVKKHLDWNIIGKAMIAKFV